jgi:hypothetical protein
MTRAGAGQRLASLLLGVAVVFLTTLALPRALAVAPLSSVYFPHSRAGRAEAPDHVAHASQSKRRGRARVWREVGRPQRSEDGRVRGNPTETRAQAALTLGSLGSSAVPYVGDYGSAFLSVVNFGAFPSWANFVDACLDCVGAAAPVMGPTGTIRRIERFGGVGDDLAGAGEDIQRFAKGFADGGDELVELYRAVKPDELADIERIGGFQSLPGLEGKYFTTSPSAASSYARQAVQGFGDPPYTIVSTQVPKQVLDIPGISATVDRGIPAFVLPNDTLPGLQPVILLYMPVPP